MENYYCLDVAFPEIEFDKYMPNSKTSQITHHAHLYSNENEIELRILFEPDTYFGTKLSHWFSAINLKKFGSFIKVSNESKNHLLQKIDFSSSCLIRAIIDTTQFEGNFEYISIKLDSVKFYWEPDPNKLNSGDFYLKDDGFKVVNNYYTTLFGNNGKFDIPRMHGRDNFYDLEKSKFRPEFEFGYSDSVNNNKATITKIPKIHFKYNADITEQEGIIYANIVRLLASFYFHFNIEFKVSKIYLKAHTISIKKVHKPIIINQSGSLYGFKNSWNFDKFLQASWQNQALKNFKKLSKVIELFNQSHIVDYSSRFLIRFIIIEVCMGGKKTTEPKFTEILSQDEKTEKYNKALSILLQTVTKEEHCDFENKWKGIINKLEYKPIKSPLETFLLNQELPIDDFPITVGHLIEIRNNLIHGSIDKVKPTKLEKANIFLYRIAGILILNLLGLKDWELDTNLK